MITTPAGKTNGSAIPHGTFEQRHQVRLGSVACISGDDFRGPVFRKRFQSFQYGVIGKSSPLRVKTTSFVKFLFPQKLFFKLS